MGSFLTTTGDHFSDAPYFNVPAAGEGGGVQAYVSYDIAPPWDLRLTGSGNWLSDAQYYSYGAPHVRSKSHADYYFVDFDAGYSFKPSPSTDVRLAGGVEYANFSTKFTAGVMSGGLYHYDYGLHNGFWGVGPHIGAEGSLALGRSGFSLVGWVDGSALFGDLSQSGNFAVESSGAGGRTAFSARAYAGVSYALPIPNVDASIQGGLQVQQWWNVNDTALGNKGTSHASETFWGPMLGFELRY